LESDLSDGDNIENVTVTAFVKNANGSRAELGSDEMKVNIKKRSFIISPDEVTIEGGRNVVLRIRHNDGSTGIPSENTDYKLIWRTSGNYGQLSGRNIVETRYNDDLILFQSQDEEVERGEDEVTVDIYARPKGSSEDYQLVDDARATVITVNDEDCDFELYPLKPLFEYPDTANNCPPESSGQAYSGSIVAYVPIDENATSYSIEWTEIYNGEGNAYLNSPSFNWTNENFDTTRVRKDGNVFIVFSQWGNGAACRSNPNVGAAQDFLNGITGFATVKVCYD
jgi:hypothetical protein